MTFPAYTLSDMWTILEHRRVEKAVAAAPLEVQQRYEKWKDIVRVSGPQGLKLIRGFRDEGLAGNWKGYRSSRLNIQHRVIYKVYKDQVLVQVEPVTAHDYRR